jgi:hypothetical protein
MVTTKVETATAKVFKITLAKPRGAINNKARVIKPLINAEARFLMKFPFSIEIIILEIDGGNLEYFSLVIPILTE